MSGGEKEDLGADAPVVNIKYINGLISFVGSIGGFLIMILIGAFYLGNEWNYWSEIREAHKKGDVINPIGLDQASLSQFVKESNLPDVSKFVTKADLESARSANFIKYGDEILIEHPISTRQNSQIGVYLWGRNDSSSYQVQVDPLNRTSDEALQRSHWVVRKAN